jgi:hypothetical protein
MQELGDMSKMTGMAKMLTPEQAIELYKSNAALALEVINTAIESTARLRKKQFEGEEEARAFQKKHVRSAAEASGRPLEARNGHAVRNDAARYGRFRQDGAAHDAGRPRLTVTMHMATEATRSPSTNSRRERA